VKEEEVEKRDGDGVGEVEGDDGRRELSVRENTLGNEVLAPPVDPAVVLLPAGPDKEGFDDELVVVLDFGTTRGRAEEEAVGSTFATDFLNASSFALPS
jgi:hypothetical protein